MILEHFLIEENGENALVVVVDKETFSKIPEFEMDVYDEYNNEHEVTIEPIHIVEFIGEELDIIVYEEGDPHLEECRRLKVD